MTRVLIVLTSAATTETGKPAGYYLPEAAHVRVYQHTMFPNPNTPFTTIQPYYSFVQAGFHIDFASPNGPYPPVNQQSVEVG
jgi:hypothetical protein